MTRLIDTLAAAIGARLRREAAKEPMSEAA